MNKNLLYVTWGEVIVENGIFRNQVIEQLKVIKRTEPNLQIHLLSGIPFGNLKLLKRPKNFFRELKTIRENCESDGITFQYRFILGLSPWFYTPHKKMNFYDSFQESFIKRFLRKKKISIVHCRSYNGTRLMLKIRKKNPDYRYKIVFDTRGNYPEEGLLKLNLGLEWYSFWKRLEKELLDSSDAVVNVSDTFTDHVKAISKNPNIHTIYTSANLSNFFRFTDEERSQLREKFGINNDCRVLLYLGELNEIGWHRRSNLFNLYTQFKKAFAQTKLLLITASPKKEIEEHFLQRGFDNNELLVFKGHNQKEVNYYLNIADYSALPFKKIESEFEGVIGYTMIASKTGEYLATGLPVIVNNKIGAASKLVNETQTGITYEMDNEASVIPLLKEFEANKALVIERCEQTAKRFDAKINAEKYLAIYDKLLLQQ